MVDCGESDYQAVEYAGLFDLKGAQILRAEINSVDQANNTADITLLDECEAYASRDVSEVEFFYHCEDSTGTIEDLARGHRAFKEADVVYVLAIPTQGDIAERFYVVGHVDIRGTERCNFSEYLLIGIDGNDSGNEFLPKFTWITIFDVGTGSALDLAAFENIDELSPPKPSSFPCLYDGALSWIEYNFRNSIPAYAVGCAHHDTPGSDYGTVVTGIREETFFGSDYVEVKEGDESTTTAYCDIVNHSHRGLFYTLGRYDGFDEEIEKKQHVPRGTLWWRLVDTTNSNAVVPIYLEFTAIERIKGEWRRLTGTINVATSEVSVSFSADFDMPTISALNITSTISAHSSSSPGAGDYQHTRSFYPISPTYCTGEMGFYVLALCDDYLRLADSLEASFAGVDWPPVQSDWFNIVVATPYHSSLGWPNMIRGKYGLSCGVISFFQDVDVLVEPIPLPTCLAVNKPLIAHGLDLAVRPLRRKIFETYHPIWSGKRPSMFTAMRRKTNA